MSVFSADDNEIPENPFEALVGEGKKFTDPDELAKAKIHADRTIAQRNRELEELRAELAARVTFEEMVSKISPTAQPTPSTVTPEAHQPAKPTTDAPDVAALVKQEIEKRNQADVVQRNVQEVTAALLKHFGDEDAANRAVRLKAAELGLSVTWLEEVATKSPKAFYTTLGINPDQAPATQSSRPTSGDVNPQALQQNTSVKPGTYAFYENIRKTDPTLYFSPRIQNLMHKEALANPEAFKIPI